MGGLTRHRLGFDPGCVGSVEWLVIRKEGKKKRSCTLQKSRMSGLYGIHLLPRHVTSVQNRKAQRGPLIKICGLQKTENASFFSSFVSLETCAPWVYQKAHSLSPLQCLYPNLFHPTPIFFCFCFGACPNYRCKLRPSLAAVRVCMEQPPRFVAGPLHRTTFNGLSSTGAD